MVVSKRAAMARAAQPKGGDARRGAAWAEQSGGVSSIAADLQNGCPAADFVDGIDDQDPDRGNRLG